MHEMQTFERFESCSDVQGKTFYEPVQNPLWIDLILDRVFSFLPKSALANCRLVSRQWLKVSERHFVDRNHQRPTTIIIYDTDDLLSFLSTFVRRRDCGFDCPDSPDSCPWISYRLKWYDVSPFQQQLLMNICGNCMTRVSMDLYERLKITHALFLFLTQTPYLESLDLTCSVNNDAIIKYPRLEPLGQSIFEFFETLKNLDRPYFTHLRRFRFQFLRFEDIAQEDIEPFFSSLFQLMPHLQDFGILQLESRIPFEFITAAVIQALQVQVQVKVQVKHQEKGQNSSSFLSQLVSLQLPHLSNQHLHDLHRFSLYNSLRLEKFWQVSFWDRLDWKNLLTFLQGQAETLKTLCLAPYAGILLLHFPLNFTLDHVTTLKIFRWTQSLDEVHLFVPHILVHFPNLKRLTIFRQHDGYSTDIMTTQLMQRLALPQKNLRMTSMLSNLVTFDPLTTIKFIGSSCYKEDEEFLICLTKFCPSVTDLELDFRHHRDTLAIHPVFDGWRKLKRMVIYFYGWKQPSAMESFFDGTRQPENQASCPRFCISVMKNFLGRDWYIVHEYDKGRDRETGGKFPSVLLLQDLKTFKIYVTHTNFEDSKSNEARDQWFLSDLSVLTTLVRMPKLREFSISESLVIRISPSVLRTLNDALNLEKCLVGDKDGELIQFEIEVKDLTCDCVKGQSNFLSLLCGRKTCCTIV